MAKQSNVDRIYDDLKNRISRFDLKPKEKLIETEIANQLGVSRTPLREALNRLVSEGFLTFKNDHGFSCRNLDASHILDLYQAREAVEGKMVELACQKNDASTLKKLREILIADESHYQETTPTEELVKTDEAFHMEIAKLSQNSELIRILKNLNDRLRFIRTIDLHERRKVTPNNHMAIVDAMLEGNIDHAVSSMQSHIVRSSEEATDAVRKAYVKIYVPN